MSDEGIVMVLPGRCHVITRDGLTNDDRGEDYGDAHYTAETVGLDVAEVRRDHPDDVIDARELDEPCATLDCAGCGIDVGGEEQWAITHWPPGQIEAGAARAGWFEHDSLWWCAACVPVDAELPAGPGPNDQPLF